MQQSQPCNNPVEDGRGSGQVDYLLNHLCVLVFCSTRDTRLCIYEIAALASVYLCPRDSIIFIRPLLNTLLDSVYPPPEEESDRQKEEEWQPEVQRLCMELQQILTRWSI